MSFQGFMGIRLLAEQVQNSFNNNITTIKFNLQWVL